MKQPTKNDKIMKMKQISKYSYIFLKLATSIFLLFVILLMGYALVKSYRGVENEVFDFNSRFELISQSVAKNNVQFKNIDEKTNKLINKIVNIENILEKNQQAINKEQYLKDMKKLIDFNKVVQKQINQIYKDLNNENINISSQKKSDKPIEILVKTILTKYKNGEDIKKEISYLNSITTSNKDIYFEKLNLIENKNFYGLKNLENKFEVSIEQFVQYKFFSNNTNVVLDFLFKFISVKPNNLTVYENENLNILMDAKKLIEKEDIENALKLILLLDKDTNIFSDWINQAEIFLEFKRNIEKVI